MSDTEIILIEPSVQNATATALVKSKHAYELADLARKTNAELSEIFRSFYHRVKESGLLTIINVAIQQHGRAFPAHPRYEWEFTSGSMSIKAAHNADANKTEIFKDDKVKLSNAVAGQEYCNPGDWLHLLIDRIQALDAERRALLEAEREQRREGLILDLLDE